MDTLDGELVALVQVILIDLVLAGDNAIVVGIAASRVRPEVRARVIFWGIAGAVVLRIAFAAITVQLLAVIGLTLAGGILLLWVCWKMYRELKNDRTARPVGAAAVTSHDPATGSLSFAAAVTQIIVADVSMSLDNVLAVAGAARDHTWVLIAGLGTAVLLMAVAAAYIAKLLARYPWIAWIGLLVIAYVALEMMWRGSLEIACSFSPSDCRNGTGAILGALLK